MKTENLINDTGLPVSTNANKLHFVSFKETTSLTVSTIEFLKDDSYRTQAIVLPSGTFCTLATWRAEAAGTGADGVEVAAVGRDDADKVEPDCSFLFNL